MTVLFCANIKVMVYILMVCCLFFDIIYIVCKRQNKNVIGLFAKTIASLCFIFMGYLGYKHYNSNFTFWILIGLILDGLGDLFLAFRNIFLKHIMFFAGAVSFLLGHIMYLKAQFPIANNFQLQCVIGGVTAGALIFVTMESICRFHKAYKYLGIIYCIMISTMASFAVGIYLTNESTTNLFFMIGSILFMCSDTILILNNFSKKEAWMHPVYSVLYYVAQLLISYSLFLL